MPVLAQFAFVTPVLDRASRGEHVSTLELDGHCVLRGGGIGWRIWAETDDRDAFEDDLDADGTVASYELLDSEESRHLYKAELSDAGRRASVLPLLGECGGEFVGGKLTAREWSIRLRFPNDAALQTFSDACNSRENGSIRVESIRRETTCDDPAFGLTPSQREAMRVALEEGYFDIPRGTTLGELSAGLDVSDQAVSERLRRAQKRVFERVLVGEE